MAISEKDKLLKVVDELELTDKGLARKKVFFSRLKRKIFKHVWILRGLITLGCLIFLSSTVFFASIFLSQTKVPAYTRLAYNFVFTPNDVVKELDGNTNILFLGKGGEGHEAPDLTDTMLFISINREQEKITMISLARDIWITPLRTKLNSVYYWGNKKETGGGIILAKATVEEILGQPVHYAAVLDFSGFKKIIDVLGGVEVEVETSFIDTKYPISGRENDECGGDLEFKCRYETVSFAQGKQMMDGETALKFVRSRNAEGDEGTDFARQKRQQKVLKAVETKILSREILFSPKRLLKLKDAVLGALETDINQDEGAVLAGRVLRSRDDIESMILPEDLLVNPPLLPKYDNLYVFIPKKENWSEIHWWILCKLEGKCS